MNKEKRKRLFRLVTVLCAAIFVLGSQMTVFAATDLVGRGTAGGVSTATASVAEVTKGSTSAAAQSAVSKASSAAQKTATGTAATAATTSKVRATVQTGVMDRLYPFLIGIGAAFAVFAFFFHLQMNQVRYGKSEKYYKELLDFICACKP
ncbi:MAG: hypothetical protein IKE31_12475 [Eubacterium sp.]|nr:hypothetical protein [Eubacterium sp.]